MPYRILAGVIGLFFLAQALQWLLAPAQAAAVLGMPLLDGLGRNTQIGDIGALFLGLGGMSLYGAWRADPHWLRPPACLLLAAAAIRTVATGVHGADFPPGIVGVEVVAAALLLLAAARVAGAAHGATTPAGAGLPQRQ